MATWSTRIYCYIFYCLNGRRRYPAHRRLCDKLSYFLANIEWSSHLSSRSSDRPQAFRKGMFGMENFFQKSGPRNTQEKHLITWEKNQEAKVENQIFGDSVSKSSKNNLTEIGFGDFLPIYKRGNENWEKSWWSQKMCWGLVTKYGGVAQATKPLGKVKTHGVPNNSEKTEAKVSGSWGWYGTRISEVSFPMAWLTAIRRAGEAQRTLLTKLQACGSKIKFFGPKDCPW